MRAPSAAEKPAADADLFDLNGPEGAEGPVTRSREAKRGPGRPPGSANKRTEDLRRFILSRFRHPVVALTEIYSMPVEELAAYVGCDKLDALALQIKAAAEVAPYVDSKMPARIQVTDRDRLPAFGLEFAGGQVSVTDPAGNKLSLLDLAARAKDAMHQRLIEGEAIKSNGDGSNDEGQGVDALTYSGD